MKTTLFVMLVILLVEVASLGCVRNSDRAGQQSKFVDEYGRWKCFTNLWIMVSQPDQKISVERLIPGGTAIETAVDWKTGKGWFVFAENNGQRQPGDWPEKVWIYNGKYLRLLLINPEVGSAVRSEPYPVPVPDVVKHRLDANRGTNSL